VRTPTLRRLAAGLSAGVLAFGLVACGSDSSTDSSSAAGSSAADTSSAGTASSSASIDAAAATVTANEADFSIALSSSTLTAGPYTFNVENTGKATHSLTIQGPGGVDVTSDTLQGGQTTTMTVTLQPGTYQVYCPIGNHREMGMDTTLTVS
jgi:plastocyanin